MVAAGKEVVAMVAAGMEEVAMVAVPMVQPAMLQTVHVAVQMEAVEKAAAPWAAEAMLMGSVGKLTMKGVDITEASTAETWKVALPGWVETGSHKSAQSSMPCTCHRYSGSMLVHRLRHPLTRCTTARTGSALRDRDGRCRA